MVGYIIYSTNGELWHDCYVLTAAMDRDIAKYKSLGIAYLAIKSPVNIELYSHDGLIDDLTAFDHSQEPL
jgi:hypothetical protein